MRITIVSDLELVNANYRAYQPMRELWHLGHEMHYARRGEPRARASDVVKSDVLYIHRFIDEEILAVARHCRANGVAVVWDNDDDVTAIPQSHPRYRHLGGIKAQMSLAATTRMVRLVDIVTTPSAVLAGKFRALGANDVRVVENFLPREFMGMRPRAHDGIVIGWIAGLEHQLDYQTLLLRNTLLRLFDAFEDLRVHSVGLGLGLPPSRYDRVPAAAFLDLAGIAATYDIGIAPLADIPFNRARSNVKLKEYAAAGVPWLASPVGAYAHMGSAEGGRLVNDDAWYEELEAMIIDQRTRRKLAKRATKWGREQGMERNISQWISVFSDAVLARRNGDARAPERSTVAH